MKRKIFTSFSGIQFIEPKTNIGYYRTLANRISLGAFLKVFLPDAPQKNYLWDINYLHQTL